MLYGMYELTSCEIKSSRSVMEKESIVDDMAPTIHWVMHHRYLSQIRDSIRHDSCLYTTPSYDIDLYSTKVPLGREPSLLNL